MAVADLEAELAAELAGCVRVRDEAHVLASKAGFPRERLPSFDTPSVFWTKIVDDARAGIIIDGALALARAAAKAFPGNETLQRIARELGKDRSARDGDSTVLTNELQRYLKKARSLHRTVRLVGLETKVRMRIDLEDLHVASHVVIDRGCRGRDVHCSAQLSAMVDQRPGAPPRERLPSMEALAREWEKGTRGIVLLGDPGSGKTTQLKRVLLELGRAPHDEPRLGLPEGTIPVYLPLRNLRDRSAGLPAFIQQELHSPVHDVREDFGRRLCQRGRVLYLLDGLDEVALEERAAVARWIEQCHQHAHDSYFLISSRYAGYTNEVELDGDLLELHLQPLDDEQSFIERWCTILEQVIEVDRQQAEREAKRKAGQLARMLSPIHPVGHRLGEMTRNPLLLTAICLAHDDHEPPPSAAPFYDRIIATLASRWRDRHSSALPLPDTLEVLRSLAVSLHEQAGRTRARRDDLLGPLSRALERMERAAVDAGELLRALCDESGFLTTWGPDEHGFAYVGLQEHLVAQHQHARTRTDPSVVHELAERFEDAWWQEVSLQISSSCELAELHELMRAVARRPEFVRWAESAMGSVEPFTELWTSSSGLVVDAAAERRWLAALEHLRRKWPRQIHGLGRALRDHPSAAVRAWWRGLAESIGEPAETLVALRGGVELVLIEGGRFSMGSPRGEGDRDEHPQHAVELEAFYMARAPVTNAQYLEYLSANPGATAPEHWNHQPIERPDHPVVGVSWYEAAAYCAWAELELPTEAQWEHACRAGTSTRYWSGNGEDDLDRVSWCFVNSSDAPQAVRQKAANAFGLYDVHGNVWEWCKDAYGSYDTSPRAGDGLRHEPVGDAKRVRRGGGFRALAGFARSAIRGHWHPRERYDDLGFRPARAIRSGPRRGGMSGA